MRRHDLFPSLPLFSEGTRRGSGLVSKSNTQVSGFALEGGGGNLGGSLASVFADQAAFRTVLPSWSTVGLGAGGDVAVAASSGIDDGTIFATYLINGPVAFWLSSRAVEHYDLSWAVQRSFLSIACRSYATTAACTARQTRRCSP